MPVSGADAVARNIIRYGGGFTNHVNKVMGEIRVLMDTKVTQNISLTDHSLEDLRWLGHPYARRNPQDLHTPNYQVHKQSGKLLSSKESGVERASITGGQLKAAAFVKLDEGKAQHALFVVLGTSKMIPRPVLEGSRNEVLPKAMDLLKRNLRDFTVNFK